MTTDRPALQPKVILLGIPHPATRALAAYLGGVLAACEPPVGYALVTEERAVVPGEAAIHLRPDVTAALGLAASLEHHAGRDRLAACALAARMDERWRDLPRLAMERVLANPAHAVGTLSTCLGLPITGHMLAAADRGLPALRSEMAAWTHPLAFFLALGAATDMEAPSPVPDSASDDEMPGGHERSPDAAAKAASTAARRADLAHHVFVLAEDNWAALPARSL